MAGYYSMINNRKKWESRKKASFEKANWDRPPQKGKDIPSAHKQPMSKAQDSYDWQNLPLFISRINYECKVT